MNRKTTAAAIIAVAVLTNTGFTMLGSIFNYPDVLKDPTGEILASFRAHQSAVIIWFTVLALAAALFAPIALGVSKLRDNRFLRRSVPVGIAAAVVQTIGLSRWPLLVPFFARDAASTDATIAAAAERHFHTAHVLLGNVIGETCGYALTATWTVLVVIGLTRTFAGRAFTTVGVVSALMIATGIASPLDLALIDTVNFAGYVLWSVWLLWLAVVLLRRNAAPHHDIAAPVATIR